MKNEKPALTYEVAVENFRRIKPGDTKGQVAVLLGEPRLKASESWAYDFSQLEGIPDLSVGTQVFYGGTVFFSEAGLVTDSRFVWMDETGPTE